MAILKLYAVLSQAHFVKQQAADWEGAFLGIIAVGFPLLLKHTAEVVIQQDKGYSNMVGGLLSQAPPSISHCLLLCQIRAVGTLAGQLDCSLMVDLQTLLRHHFITEACAASHYLLIHARLHASATSSIILLIVPVCVMCTELLLMHMVMDRCEAWQQQS